MALRYCICAVIGYLTGSLNFAVIVSKLKYKKDIRDYGSKNAGMTNTTRTFGKGAGALVFIGDFVKPMIACGISMFLISGNKNIVICGYIAGLATMLGHIFPLYFGLKGGKGVATMFGMALALSPAAAVIMAIPFFACLAISKMVSLSSMLASLFFPIGIFLIYNYFTFLNPAILNTDSFIPLIVSLFVPVIVIFMHRTNILRIIKGEERKVGKKNKETQK